MWGGRVGEQDEQEVLSRIEKAPSASVFQGWKWEMLQICQASFPELLPSICELQKDQTIHAWYLVGIASGWKCYEMVQVLGVFF